ncbi:MAG: hypothetical protein ACI4EQ_00095 [Lachnospiraceae bacterium]
MAENSKQKKQYTILISIIMFSLTVLLMCFFSYIKDYAVVDIIRNTVLAGMGSFMTLLVMAQTREEGGYDYDNATHSIRFLMLYLVCLAIAVACGFLPGAGWPFLVIFVALCLFSNMLTGVSCGSLLLVISVLLSGSGIEIFTMYFICGLLGAVLFRGLCDTYKIGVPLIVSLLFLVTAETATVVLYANETLKWELFLIPFMNVIISLILLLIILKMFYSRVIYLYRDKYMEINDPECPLLVELKEHSKDEYYLAMHTAYFCERIAKKLSLDEEAAKTAGYYHRIGVLSEENTWKGVWEKIENYDFPPKPLKILREYVDKDTQKTHKETAVLIMSNAVISSVLYLLAHSKEELNYDRVIDAVFKKKLETGILNDCDITMAEITAMQKLFKEEKLYYDFLR